MLEIQVSNSGSMSRILVNYNNQNINALDLIPPLLQQYISNSVLNSSLIQILNFQTEALLEEAISYLRSDPSESEHWYHTLNCAWVWRDYGHEWH